MTSGASLLQTTVGKKALMAVTGVIWFGYLIAHMSGNLLIFAGPEPINDYSRFLHENVGLLWAARVVLIAALLGHIVASTQLTMQNLSARPIPYSRRDDVATNYAARTMIWSGPILLFFILYHVAHLTLGALPGHPYDPHHVYNNLVYGFRIPWVSALYVLSMAAVALHLYHGVWSFFQSLGLSHPRYNPLRRQLATAITLLVVVGFLSVPVAVLSGYLEPVEAVVAAAPAAE